MTRDNPSYIASKKWTVMVFMGVATIKGNVPLIDSAKADLAEMSFVGSDPTHTADAKLNIFVQVHGQGWPRRGRIMKGPSPGIDGLERVPEGKEDPSRGSALESFILWALETAKHDPKNPDHHTMLVMWGHAYDFAIGRELTKRGIIDALDFAELSRVLERLQAKFQAPDSKLDILGFDACDLSTVEVACQLRPFARYLLGSQIGIPLPGWPYDRILDRLREPMGRAMSPVELGSYVVRRFCESYDAESRVVALTLLFLEDAPKLSDHVEYLALALNSAMSDSDDTDIGNRITALFSESQTVEGKPYVDVADLCLNLMRRNGNQLVVDAAKALGDFLISPNPPLVTESAVGQGRPFIVEHGRNTGQAARLNGLSIYAPHVAPDRDVDAVRHLYRNFDFAKETHWDELVHSLVEPI